jgi:hypothetical protein
MTRYTINRRLPLQGANGLGVLFTQGVGQSLSKAVAIGLDYIGPSARRLYQCKRLKSGFSPRSGSIS